MYHLAADGSLIPYVEDDGSDFGDGEGQELGIARSMSSAQDYVARARYLAGTQYGDADSTNGISSALEARRVIAKLERATTELKQGIIGKSLPSISRYDTHFRR